MKKIIASGMLAIGLFFLMNAVSAQSPTSSPTQEFNFERAYQDYEYNLSVYDRAYNVYKDSRTQYLQFKTITAKEEAQKATLTMLEARDEVVKTYLTAIRMRLKEAEGVHETDREANYKRIDEEFKWFASHKERLSSAGSSLDDLVKDSDEAAERYELTKMVIYSVLNNIAIGKTSNVRSQLSQNISDLKTKINEIRNNQDKDLSTIERALPEIEDKLSRSKDKEMAASAILNSMKNTEKNKASVFSKAQTAVENSYFYLKEANTYLLEIMRQIKTN